MRRLSRRSSRRRIASGSSMSPMRVGQDRGRFDRIRSHLAMIQIVMVRILVWSISVHSL